MKTEDGQISYEVIGSEIAKIPIIVGLRISRGVEEHMQMLTNVYLLQLLICELLIPAHTRGQNIALSSQFGYIAAVDDAVSKAAEGVDFTMRLHEIEAPTLFLNGRFDHNEPKQFCLGSLCHVAELPALRAAIQFGSAEGQLERGLTFRRLDLHACKMAKSG